MQETRAGGFDGRCVERSGTGGARPPRRRHRSYRGVTRARTAGENSWTTLPEAAQVAHRSFEAVARTMSSEKAWHGQGIPRSRQRS